MTHADIKTLMSPVDRAWLQMDEPGNPMVLSALFQLDGPVDAAEFQKALVERLLLYPRFRQRVTGAGSTSCWQDAPDLDFGYHVQVRRLPERDFERQLHKAVSAEVSRDLDEDRPLWRLLLFPHPGGPITVLFRAHHAMADGIALVTLLIDSTDSGVGRSARHKLRRHGASPHGGPLGQVIDRLELLNRGLGSLAPYLREIRQPRRFLQRLHQGRATLAAIGHMLGVPDNRPAPLGRPLSGHRIVAWLDGLPFAPVRTLAHRLDVRVNDVFLSLLAGAFGRVLRQDITPWDEGQELRISIPVNLRRGRGRELGNQFGLVLLDLPIGLSDPSQRLRLVAQRMAVLKASLQARVTLFGLAAAGYLPVPLEKKLVGMVSAKAVAVVSNLPGPKRHVRIAGARLRNLVFWPPQAGGIGVGVSFFTYAGEMSIGISADRALLPNPQRLLDAMQEELRLLHGGGRARTGSHAARARSVHGHNSEVSDRA